MRAIRLCIVIVLVALTGGPAIAQEQSPRASAIVRDREVYLGDAVELRVLIENAPDDVAPPDVVVPAVRTDYAGEQRSSSIQIMNGRRTENRSLIFSYLLQPERAGRFTIPPLEIEAAGETLTTEPVSVFVLEPQAEAGFELELIPETDRPYERQRVKVTALLHFPNERIRNVEFLGDWNQDDFGLFLLTPERALRNQRISFLGEEAAFAVVEVDRDGRRARAIKLELIVVPNRPGSLSTGPIAAIVDVQRPGDRNPRRVAARSQVLTFDVRELPSEGRPPNFNWLVGEYDVSASARPTNVNVGDPIGLSVLVEGTPPIDAVEPPDLSEQPGFADLFKPSPQGWNEVAMRDSDRRSFKTVIRATGEQVSEVPPIELPYFDPEAGEYRIARSDPIALSVRATREVTLADAEGAPLAPGVATEPLESAGPGIPANDDSMRALRREGFDLVTIATSPLGAAIIGGPPVLALATAGVLFAVRRHDPEQRRRKTAPGRARRALRRATDAQDVERVIRRYVADVEGCALEAVTPEECRRLAESAGLEDERALARLLERCIAPRFGGDESAAREAAAQSADVIRDIDRRMTR